MIWEQIRANRRRSTVLIAGMAVVLLVLGYVGGEALAGPGAGIFGMAVAAVIWLVQMMVYATSAESVLLQGAYAQELSREDNPRLHNLVEEMKLASGLPFMPKIYLIDDPAPNAFAIGGKPDNSVVAVTSGLLHRLNRDELQGVIAHEMGHLRNADVQFMTLAAVMLGSITLLSEIIWRSMRYGGRASSRSRSRGGGQAQAIILIVALLLAVLGPLLAQLLYFACSRKREYLADASAAQYTRYPEGLAAALGKIAQGVTPPAFASKTTAPMFIVNPLQAGGGGLALFATHPPITERIRILRNMTGAGLGDYEAAYARACGESLIGPESLRRAGAPLGIRAASNEGPLESRHEVRDTVYRQHGYIPLPCPCGVNLSVPETFTGDSLNCIHCGRHLAVPAAKTPPQIADPAERLQYRRRGGGWESFRCTCGRTIQISPAFSAPHIRCTNCRATVNVIHPVAA